MRIRVPASGASFATCSATSPADRSRRLAGAGGAGTRRGASGEWLRDFDYHLPAELIAQVPPDRRDDSRLLVFDRASGQLVHDRIRSLPQILRRGDLLVFNDVRVRRARIHWRAPSGGRGELLLLRELDAGVWECLGRPGKRLRPGLRLDLPGGVVAEIVGRRAARVHVAWRGVSDVEAYLERHGEIPLPPYIKRPQGPSEEDRTRYQTVFARQIGAVAAPTAGLHFSSALLAAIGEAGVATTQVTLNVGPATFLPVRAEALDDCELEPEWASLSESAVRAIDSTRRSGGRVIAVGTTTTRALESRAAGAGTAGLRPGAYAADAFIRPGFEFTVIDGMLTNFHLPRSTLLVLVSAMAGRERILSLYEAAVREKYRFYSYGDATLLV